MSLVFHTREDSPVPENWPAPDEVDLTLGPALKIPESSVDVESEPEGPIRHGRFYMDDETSIFLVRPLLCPE